MSATLLAVEIGGTKLQLVLGDDQGNIIDRSRFLVQRSEGAAGIRRHIEAALQPWIKAHGITAAGVGFGGPIDWRTGQICCSQQISGWDNFPLADWLGNLISAPVKVDNDTNVGALAEALRGAGCGFNPVFYTNCGSGVGGGLVVEGKIYHGAKPGEAEFGHLRMDRQGTILENLCSGWAMDKKIRDLSQQHPANALNRLSAGYLGCEARFLLPALQAGDETAWQLLQETAENMAFGLSHVVHLFHPEILILGGGLALIGEPWRQAVAEALPASLMKAFLPGPQVQLAALKEEVVPQGALLLAALAAAERAESWREEKSDQ